MKRIKYSYLLCFLMAIMLFPFLQPVQTAAEDTSFADITPVATVSTVEADEGFLEPITDWFGSIGENVEGAFKGIEETVTEIVSYIGDLVETVDEAISTFSSGNTSSDEVKKLQNKVNQADDILDDLGLKSNEHTVYRVLREDEDPDKGIFAKAPEREHITIAGHVNNGGKRTFKGSKYISTTKSFDVALENATKDIMDDGKSQDLRIVQIDLNKVTEKYYDLTDPAIQDKYLVNSKGEPWEKVRRYANKSQELLVEKSIPANAITLIGRPSEFMK
ncbi:hypothetical protein GI584_01665 [Gracilibacillus salitolerans]|uniref:DUF7587 domain-containing protein n=1 Tax=Gracilibacillus salitolerans TaxID=2663022 RepID=A0A5Q2TF66_9BACI|nr:hypothetical protein [Gracilibacillus salitolerans]QGH32837.1 hypothetical protein GI584_01665 [Gracilibacillus salitolerans]